MARTVKSIIEELRELEAKLEVWEAVKNYLSQRQDSASEAVLVEIDSDVVAVLQDAIRKLEQTSVGGNGTEKPRKR